MADPVSVVVSISVSLVAGGLGAWSAYLIFRERTAARFEAQQKDLVHLEDRCKALDEKCRDQDKRIDKLFETLTRREAAEQALAQHRAAERSRPAVGPLPLPHLPRSTSE